MGKSIVVKVFDGAGMLFEKYTGVRSASLDHGVLLVHHLGEDNISSGVVLRDGWSFRSSVEIDDTFKVGDWVAKEDGELMEIIDHDGYREDTGEASYACRAYYETGVPSRTVWWTEGRLTKAQKPDYVKD